MGRNFTKIEKLSIEGSCKRTKSESEDPFQSKDSTESATDTTSKQPDNETPPQSKVFTESRRSGPKWPGEKPKGKKSTDTSEQSMPEWLE
ncbi:hypothetical protein BASA83_013286 [Batrachochytrium salamandrivorans]|nr:hypothetical protein BASA83_013286 [Batrachochytrium salamandrivorans]